MHEFSLIANLLTKIEAIARENNAQKVSKVEVQLGALAHISPEHFREHFVQGTVNTVADGAHLEISTLDDIKHPHAQEILLKNVEIDQ